MQKQALRSHRNTHDTFDQGPLLISQDCRIQTYIYVSVCVCVYIYAKTSNSHTNTYTMFDQGLLSTTQDCHIQQNIVHMP